MAPSCRRELEEALVWLSQRRPIQRLLEIEMSGERCDSRVFFSFLYKDIHSLVQRRDVILRVNDRSKGRGRREGGRDICLSLACCRD